MSLASLKRHSPFAHLYDGVKLTAAVRRSLTFMLIGNIFGNMFAIICGAGTTAMIGLANTLNAGDLAFGILNGIPQAAALFQLPFSLLVNRTHKRKRYMMTFGVFSRAIWIVFGFIPLVIPGDPSRLPLWTLLFLLGISSACGSSINVCWFPWFADIAPMSIRARWISMRDTLLNVANLLFGLLVAYLLDNLPAESKYIIIFMFGGALGIMDMVCYSFCKEEYGAPPKTLHIRGVLSNVLANKPFFNFMIFWTAWCFTTNFSGAYLNRYAMNEMGLTYTQLMIFGTIAASIGTIVCLPRWAHLLDKHGCKSVMMVSCLASTGAMLFFLFCTPGDVVPILLRNFIGAAFWCASNLAANSMQLSCSPDDMRPSYIAIFSCFTALAGTALGTVSGGVLLEFLADNGVGGRSETLFSGFDRYKILISISIVMRMVAILWFVPKTTNDRDGTVKTLLHDMIPRRHPHSA